MTLLKYFRWMLSAVAVSAMVVSLTGPSASVYADTTVQANQGGGSNLGELPQSSHHLLTSTARKTWDYFVAATASKTGLPDDRINVPVNGQQTSVNTTSPTDIAMYMMSLASARDLGIISEAEANRRLSTLLNTLEQLPKWQGFLYNWYSTTDGSVTNNFISTVDLGWYAAGLVVDRQAFPKFAAQITKLLNAMNFATLYDPSMNQMYGGYDPTTQQFTGWHYGNINTESRVADYIAIGTGDVPSKLWWGVYRTLPASWSWQNQVPIGPTVTYDGVPVFEGHYTLYGETYVPSWGGSMFEALMPTLVLKEQQLGTHALGLNDQRMVDLQIHYALDVQHYPVWGISPSALPNNGYGVFGVPGLGCINYEENGTITPHASFLALSFAPQQALSNLEILANRYHMMGPYGFYDSVNVNTQAVAHADLALDEGMILVSIDNFLHHGAIQNDFNRDSVGKAPQDLLKEEKFSIQ